jgi:transposase
MKVQNQKRYSREYKEDVVNIIKTGDKSIVELSKELEIPVGTLYRWYNKYSGSTSKREEEITEKDKELRILRKKLADVEEERDILKKAISIFSKEGENR